MCLLVDDHPYRGGYTREINRLVAALPKGILLTACYCESNKRWQYGDDELADVISHDMLHAPGGLAGVAHDSV